MILSGVIRGAAAAALIAAAVALASEKASPHEVPSIAPSTGAGLCDALKSSDFSTVGIQTNAKPSANVQDNGQSAYCVYRGRSGATGGVELDVFYPAGATKKDILTAEATAVDESGGAYEEVKLAGADDARLSLSLVSGGPHFAALVARRATLVFVISIPSGSRAKAQLLKLGRLVLQRTQSGSVICRQDPKPLC